jgi:4-hydroxy 2-oxovalerate aldolase
MALQNTLRALDDGTSWLDATVTGMGRGPGNAKSEYLVLELAQRLGKSPNLVPLMGIISSFFKPMQNVYGWGTNPYYYLSGKYGIHPTYIQQMLSDTRYDDEDILAVIEHLRLEGGKKFSINTLDAARHFYRGKPRGSWNPTEIIAGKEVLLLGAGPGIAPHRVALEQYIRKTKPIVLALNTQSKISEELIDLRLACHPTRLLADCNSHTQFPHPLITPASMLPQDVQQSLQGKTLLDYGIGIEPDTFSFSETHCTLPNSLVIAYALAVATGGQATRIHLAGFDGYGEDDPRTNEMQKLFNTYRNSAGAKELIAVTPTRYDIPKQSIYAL